MSVILIITCGITSILISRMIFQRWFNHIALYATVWMVMLTLFELQFIYFYPLSLHTWAVVIGAFLSLFLGTLTVYIWQERLTPNAYVKKKSYEHLIFTDNGNILRNIIIIFSLIGLYGALQHWSVLLNEFGSIPAVLINAKKVYQMRHDNELKGVIPYVWTFSYFAAFLAGIYMAYKGKISLIIILPIIGIILKDIAKVARNGILLGLFEFFISYLLYRHLMSKDKIRKPLNKKNYVIGMVLILILMITAASVVKLFRNPEEQFGKTENTLSQYEGNLIISPHLYFYAASQVGVLNKFLMEDEEDYPVGSNTLFGIYSFLGSIGIIEKIESNPRGYLIPAWSNTATYLRDLYNDFGIVGVLLGPYLIGFFATLLWFKFYQTGNVKYHLLLTHLYLILAISFFILATKMSPVYFGILIMYPLLVLLENYFIKYYNHN